FWPLQEGARLVMARPGGHRDVAYLEETIEREGVTTLHFVPSMLQPFAEMADPARCGSIRRVVCSGEALPPALVNRFHERFPGSVALANLYGPTEAAVDVSCWRCPRGERASVVPIGAPVWNTALYVLDEAMRPAPIGVPGELYIGGVQVARGYLNRPALTAEKFVPDPFSATPGARLYRTGDRARWRSDGAIEYLGRLDFQVKVRGFRIELGEVEAVLGLHAGVRDCAVVARADEPGEARLVAYVVGEAVDDDALRAHLRRTLPEYMLPAAFVALERLPLTPNGKLDAAALPAPEYARADRYVAPRTPAEEVMAAIWAEVLRLGRVGAEDDFFVLGGHSLLATRVVSRVREAFGVELPLRALFEGPTVSAMAARVEALRRDGAPALPPIAPVDRAGPLPLSFAQERLWFLDRLQPGSAFYNSPVALRLGGALDVAALERAIGQVVRRHESLRTVFAEVDGAPVQVIAPFAGFTLEVEDVAPGDAARRAAEEAVRPFDLAAGPLFRARLLRVAPEDHVLSIGMHHVVTDGWSQGILLRELAALYASFAAGSEVALPDLPVQYADFAAWQRAHLRGAALDAQLAFWRGRLAGAPELLELPTDRPRPAVQAFRGARIPVALDGELVGKLRALGHREGATLYMVVLAAFQLLLSRWAGSDDVVVGSPIAGRGRREVEELIGFFVNTLVLRTDLSGDPGFREALRRVRETTLGAYEHQDLPFEKLVAELRPERSLSHSPLFQVLFILNDAERAAASAPPAGAMPGLRVGGVEADSGTTRYDLTLDLSVQGDGIGGALEYSTDLFERETVERLLGQLRQLLDRVVADPALPLSRMDLLDDGERARLSAWSRGDASEISGTSPPFVHQAVAAQAAGTPDAVAVAFAGGTLSYAELDRRANQLAHYLRRRGVGPDTRVGICLERSPALPIAMLGVLKAGGAYVPLDPAYPAERLAWMLEDARAPLVLTAQAQRDRVGAHAGETLVLETAWPEIAGEPEDAPTVSLHPESLAYVIYTSGSTGRPKGVGVPHRAIAAHMAWMQRAHPLAPADRVLQKTPASFDASVWEFWAPLMAGATLAIAGPEAHRDAAQLGREVREGGITILQLVPSLLHALLEAGSLAGASSLRRLFCGGEALPAALAARARAVLGEGVEIVNLYGPTEVCIDSVTHVFDEADEGTSVPIGAPVDRVRAWVLGRAGELLPAGIPGELCLGGDQLARGYLDRPAATALAFVPDPFSGVPGGRLYRTGDRARWRPAASETERTSALPHSRTPALLEYLGRLDDQVKVRGFRVEPGEIAQALRGHPAVRDAAVVARGAGGDARLVAYFVPAAGEGRVDDAALREHLRTRLPAHMVPAAFVAMDALPLTLSGKVDRRALPAPVSAAAGRRLRPETAMEARLAEIWRALLEVDEVGVEDNFFDLGGHSLLLIRLQARLAAELGAELAVVELFQYPTVRSLAARLQGNAAAETAAADEGHDRGGARQAAMARRLAARRRGEG
ncbi:MAG: amino acid adenylation domain-containing protein, partial [Gemmatimonadetes bacterium]|nr:amino acid adenylation domain-containing protein [Gemmatimonadota bacterium]